MKRDYVLKSELRTLVFAAVVGVLSLGIVLRYEKAAFPELSFAKNISEQTAEQQAALLLQNNNVQTKQFRTAAILYQDGSAYTYFSQELSPTDAAKLMPGHGVVAWWVRYFQPLQEEEYTVGYETDGSLSYFHHGISEVTAGAKLDESKAVEIANVYLQQQTIDTAEYQLIDTAKLEKPNRLDYQFTFESRSFHVKDATSRIEVTVHGDQIGAFVKFIKVPEAWERAYETRRSRNDAAQTVAEILSAILMVIGLIFSIRFAQRYAIPKNVYVLTAIVTGSTIAMTVMSLPVMLFSFDTTQSLSGFLIPNIGIGILFSLVLYIPWVLFSFLGAQFLASDVWKNQSWITFLPKVTTKQAALALAIGSATGFFGMALQIGVYLVGKRFGFWAPPDVNIDSSLSMLAPWLFPMIIGLIAAITEELLFRQFAITLFKKYFRSLPAAIICSSLMWGFLHSNYPVDPWFARGLEITLFGLVLSVVYLRYGILASIAAHYLVDAFLTTLALWYSHSSTIQIVAAMIISIMPLLIALVLLIRSKQRGFEPSPLNKLTPHRTKAHKNPSIRLMPQQPLAKSSLIALMLLVLPAIALINIYRADGSHHASYQVSKRQALQTAETALSAHHIDPTKFRHTIAYEQGGPNQFLGIPGNENFPADAYFGEYVDTQGSNQDSAALTKKYLSPANISVRFFNILDKNSYTVLVTETGSIESITHELDERAPGANLSQPEALSIAEQELSLHLSDVHDLKLINVQNEKREARTDYTFTWESTRPIIGEAHIRYQIQVIGDEPSSFTRFFKVPESFQRTQSQLTARKLIGYGVDIVLVLTALILCIRYFLELNKKHLLPWRISRPLGLVAATTSSILALNALPVLFQQYDTTQPLAIFLLERSATQLFSVLLAGLSALWGSAMLLGAWRDQFGTLPSISSRTAVRSFFVGALAAIVFQAFQFDTEVANTLLSGHAVELVTVLGNSVSSILTNLVFIGFLVFTLKRYLKSWRLVFIIGLGTIVFSIVMPNTNWSNIGDNLLLAILAIVSGLIVIRFWLQTDLLAYASFAFTFLVLPSIINLAQQPDATLHWNGMIGLTLYSMALLACGSATLLQARKSSATRIE